MCTTNTDRQTHRDTDTETDKDTYADRDRDPDPDTDTDRHRHRYINKSIYTHKRNNLLHGDACAVGGDGAVSHNDSASNLSIYVCILYVCVCIYTTIVLPT